MKFEELIVKDMPNLPVGHPFHYLENVIKKEVLPKKPDHDKEHEDMLIKWGYSPKHTSRLTIRKDKEDVPYADRMYHIALHLKYWKELNINTEHVNKFEQESGINLEDIPLPLISEEASELEY